MNNEPKAGMSIDPEMLAAYIDKRLSPEDRAAVEAQLAADPDTYAVLVETLKAQDDLGLAANANVSARSRTWVIAAAALATAAIVVLAVRGQFTDRAPAGEMTALINAVKTERPIEARLTGGFSHAPVAPVTRGLPELSAKNLALVASAGELQQRVAKEPTRENRKAWAAAQLLTGQASAATETLTQLAAETPDDAAVLSDLSAALLARVAAGDASQIAAALERSSQAARLAPTLGEAAFNHALALEQASLLSQALDEWKRFVTIESNSEWRSEGERHVRDLEQRLASRPSARIPSSVAELLQVSDLSGMRDSLPEWRTALEGSLLISVLRAPTDVGWDRGMTSARQLFEKTGDRLTLEIWTHAHRHMVAASLVAGLVAIQQGSDLRNAGELSKAWESFRAADRLLRETDSPAVAWAEFSEADCLFFQGKTAEALDLLKSVLSRSTKAEYKTVAMRATYLLGLGLLRMGLHASVLDIQRRAADMAASLGERGFVVKARSEVADAFERLSMRDASWKERAVVLRGAIEGEDRSVRHVVTVGASRSAAAEGLVFAAEAFALEALDNGKRWGNNAAQAEALIRLADVANRRRDAEQALEFLQVAEGNLNALPDSAFADGWRADLEILRADASLAVSDAEAAAAIRRAFEVLARRSSPFRLARARWISGRSLARENPQLAREEFMKGIAAGAAQRAAVDPFGRSLAEQRWLLLKEILSLPQQSNPADADLAFVLRAMLGEGRTDVLRSMQTALAPDEVVLVFVSLENELLRWRITSSAIDREAVPVHRVDLERAAKEQSRLVRQPTSNAWSAASDRLSQLLFAGLASEPASKLTVITDELLSDISFAALRWPGSGQFLDETSDVRILASSRTARPRRTRHAGRALVIGDPATSLAASFPPLPGAREESQQIAELYADVSLLIGGDATRERVVAELPAADIVHYAGHAVGDKSDPSTSRLVLAAEDESSSFTAAEIVQLQINARVVVLAACQGALAASAGNVPVRGLASAFLKAGAQNVVASQWDIDDRHASSFLRRLHHWLAAGVPAAHAVRLAQSELRNDPGYSHPFYWAGFSVYSTIDSSDGDVE